MDPLPVVKVIGEKPECLFTRLQSRFPNSLNLDVSIRIVCKMKYRKYQDGKTMLSPNKRTWFVFPDPEALKDYPLDQLIEITPESKEKKQ